MKRLLPLILLTILYSCDKLDNHKTMIGVWCACDTKGRYYETYVDEKYFTGLYTDTEDNFIWQYEVKGDTIWFDLRDIGDRINWGRNQVVSKDHIRTNSYSEFEKKESEFIDHYRLVAMDQKIDVLTIKDSIKKADFKKRFLKRSELKKCK